MVRDREQEETELGAGWERPGRKQEMGAFKLRTGDQVKTVSPPQVSVLLMAFKLIA